MNFNNKNEAEKFKKKLKSEQSRLIKAGAKWQDLTLINHLLNRTNMYLEEQKNMADKKKKTSNQKKTTSKSTAKKTFSQKITRAEDIKNPKLSKENKIPKGATHTIISDKGNIIMTSQNFDIIGKKKPVKKTTKATVSKAKKTTPKKANVTKPKAAPKKVVKTSRKSEKRAIKFDEKYENGTDGFEKIIVIGKTKQPKQIRRSKKELKRVASVGGYTAWDGRTGKTFATQKEASDYAADHLKRTGEIISVTRTQRTITHTFKAENRADK